MALTTARIALLTAQRARAWNKDRKSRNESARHEELAVLRRQVTSPEEREKFLADAPGWRVAADAVPESLRTATGAARTFPHRHDTDGFFAQVLEKSDE